MKQRKVLKALAAGGLLIAGIYQAAHANSIPGACNTGYAIAGGAVSVNNVYCVNAQGASDTWQPFGPTDSYSQTRDVLSGDDAVFLSWEGMHETETTAFLTPNLDAGNLNSSYVTGSRWSSVFVFSSGNLATSQIMLDIGGGKNLTIGITTTAEKNGSVEQHYTVHNNTGETLRNLTFGDLFNFHPNGSLGGYNSGTTYYSDGAIYVEGDHSRADWIADAAMYLTLDNEKVMPTAWDVVGYHPGHQYPAIDAIRAVNCLVTNSAENCLTYEGPVKGDAAGILAYRFGDLDRSHTMTFDVEKTIIPEIDATSGTAGLSLLAGILFLVRDRSRRLAA